MGGNRWLLEPTFGTTAARSVTKGSISSTEQCTEYNKWGNRSNLPPPVELVRSSPRRYLMHTDTRTQQNLPTYLTDRFKLYRPPEEQRNRSQLQTMKTDAIKNMILGVTHK